MSKEVPRATRVAWKPSDPNQRRSLARYVQEDHPRAAAIRREALQDVHDLLLKLTGEEDRAFEGYVAGDPSVRVPLEAKAVFNRLQRRQPRDGNPLCYVLERPGSWSREQHLRLIEEVLVGGEGVCLEWASTYAGCLKAAGIHPLLVIAEGHAMTGYWVFEKDFKTKDKQGAAVIKQGALRNSKVVIGRDELLSLVDAGSIRLVNATRIPVALRDPNATGTKSQDNQKTFEEAEQEALDSKGAIEYAVDIRMARERLIRPYPAPDPDVFFRYWWEETRHVKLQGLSAGNIARQFPLNRLYVTLTMPRASQLRRQPPDVRDPWEEDGSSPSQQPLQDALGHRRLAVIGDPGAGKTTFLRRLVNAQTHTWLDEEPSAWQDFAGAFEVPGPLFIRSAMDLWKFIVSDPASALNLDAAAWLPKFLAYWAKNYLADTDLDEAFFMWLLKSHPCLMLVDGLDELPERSGRERIARLIENIAHRFTDCRLIVSCRPAAYEPKSGS